MKMSEELINFLKIALISIFAGIARYLDGYLRGDPFVVWKFCARIFSSGFFGWLGSEAIGNIYPSWAVVAAGISGFFGAELTSVMLRLVINKYGKEYGIKLTKKDLD